MVILLQCHKVKVIIILSSNTVNEGDLFKSRPIRLTKDNLNETVFLATERKFIATEDVYAK